MAGATREGLEELMERRDVSQDAKELALVNLTRATENSWIDHVVAQRGGWAREVLDTVNKTKVRLQEVPGAYALVIYEPPSFTLARLLEDGTAPEDALIEVQERLTSLMDLESHFRPRVLLAEAPSDVAAVESLLVVVRGTTGLAVPGPPDDLPGGGGSSLPGSLDAGTRLAALELLSLGLVAQLVERLELASLEVREDVWRPDLVSEYLSDVQIRREELAEVKLERVRLSSRLAGKEDEVKRLRDENDLVISQLHKLQEDLERLFLKNRKQQEKISGLRKGRDYRKNRVASLEEELRSKATAVEEVKHELQSVTEKLDWLRNVRDSHRDRARSLSTENKKLQADYQALAEENSRTTKRLRSIQKSRLWRYTRPIRAISRRVSR